MKTVGMFLILSVLFIGFTSIKNSKARMMYAEKEGNDSEIHEEHKQV